MQPANALEGAHGNTDNPFMNFQTIGDRLRAAMGEIGENELARRSGVPQSTIHRIVTGESKDPRKSNLTKLANALGYTYEQLFGDDAIKGEFRAEADIARRAEPTKATDHIAIPQYDTGGMGGNDGLVLRDQPGVIQNWSVSQEWLRANVPYCSSASNLCIVTGFGDSMPDMYNPGDPVIVDRGVRICDHDGVYFFRVGNEGFIKRLQRIPGEGIRVISQNKDYESWTIREGMDFEVFGKVLKAWKGRNY